VAYGTVIVGTDGSETAKLAVRHAGRLAGALGASLTVVTAFEPTDDDVARKSRAPDDVRWMLTDRGLAEEKAREGRTLAKAEGASEVRVETEAGDPAQIIVNTAREADADLVIVGSKGLTSPARFLLGSVANTVSHHAPCDVLIVHTS
jgi:nucleotide-binding universal stress UspA family protein